MIETRQDLHHYLAADLEAHNRHVGLLASWRFYDRWRYPLLDFQRRLRKTEYVVNRHTGAFWKPYRMFCRMRLRNHGIRLGFSIYPNNFGPGLSIAHWGTIVINPDARVGANCRIHPSTCLGVGNGKVPTVGDDCGIGPGAKLIGGVVLGDHVNVRANAVVTRSFPEGHVNLVGAPAFALPPKPSNCTGERTSPRRGPARGRPLAEHVRE